MRLRKPCEHNLYDEHPWGGYSVNDLCPGGEFLPEDALVVWWCEEHEANAPHDKARCWYAVSKMISRLKVPVTRCSLVEKQLDALAADQVGEPG